MLGTPLRIAVLALLPITFAVVLDARAVQDQMPRFTAGCRGLRQLPIVFTRAVVFGKTDGDLCWRGSIETV
jgi:hypothetical protein